MNIKKCRSCKSTIPGNARICPYCYKRQWSGSSILVIIIIGIFTIAGPYTYVKLRNSSPTTPFNVASEDMGNEDVQEAGQNQEESLKTDKNERDRLTRQPEDPFNDAVIKGTYTNSRQVNAEKGKKKQNAAKSIEGELSKRKRIQDESIASKERRSEEKIVTYEEKPSIEEITVKEEAPVEEALSDGKERAENNITPQEEKPPGEEITVKEEVLMEE